GRLAVTATVTSVHLPPPWRGTESLCRQGGDSIAKRDIARELLPRDYAVAINIHIVKTCLEVNAAEDFRDREAPVLVAVKSIKHCYVALRCTAKVVVGVAGEGCRKAQGTRHRAHE